MILEGNKRFKPIYITPFDESILTQLYCQEIRINYSKARMLQDSVNSANLLLMMGFITMKAMEKIENKAGQELKKYIEAANDVEPYQEEVFSRTDDIELTPFDKHVFTYICTKASERMTSSVFITYNEIRENIALAIDMEDDELKERLTFTLVTLLQLTCSVTSNNKTYSYTHIIKTFNDYFSDGFHISLSDEFLAHLYYIPLKKVLQEFISIRCYHEMD